jgi:hypothetical protein
MLHMFTCFILCVLLTGIAQAGSTVVTPQLYDPSVGFNVNVTYGRNGSLPGATDQNTSSSPQFTSPGSVPAYCSDPWHENVLGSPYTVVSASGLSASDIGTAPGGYAAIGAGDASNRIGWIMSHAPSDSNSSLAAVDERGAMQLAIWYTVDAYYDHGLQSQFSYTGGDAGMRADYNALVSFAGYNNCTTYGADFFAAEHSGNLFQDLVTVGSVPEPTTALLGSVGLVVVALWAKFRKRSA